VLAAGSCDLEALRAGDGGYRTPFDLNSPCRTRRDHQKSPIKPEITPLMRSPLFRVTTPESANGVLGRYHNQSQK
jgi:hypothetical protein